MSTSLQIAHADSGPLRLPLRPCAGIALFNAEGRVWIGRRSPKWARTPQAYLTGHIWQLPQGGIFEGEHPADAAVRELREETGVSSVSPLAEIPGWLSYELPSDLVGIALKGRYGGQRLRWFAMRFEGDDAEIDIDTDGIKSEFDAWRWADLAELPELALPFKRSVYETVACVFAPFAR